LTISTPSVMIVSSQWRRW